LINQQAKHKKEPAQEVREVLMGCLINWQAKTKRTCARGARGANWSFD